MSEPLTDKRGTVFDPARHSLRADGTPVVNRLTGVFMPRGGRKPRAAAAPAPFSPAVAPAPAQGGDATMIPDPDFRPCPGTPPPPVPSNPAPAAPSFADLKPLMDGAESPPPPADEPAKPTGPDLSEETGETIASGLELIASAAFDDDISPPPTEHKKLSQGVASWFRSNGWQYTAGAGMLLLLVGFFVRVFKREKPKAKLREWMGLDRADTARNVAPSSPPRTVQPPRPGQTEQPRRPGPSLADLPHPGKIG